MTIDEKLAAFRAKMKEANIDACIIPSSDPHQSEYVADRWKSREWISGFSGSAGTAMVTADHAGVWTDSRYFLQAETELSSSQFQLHKTFNQFTPDYLEWAKKNLPSGSKVGVDGWMISQSQHDLFERELKKAGIKLDTSKDLVSAIWSNRPDLPSEKIFVHDATYTGESRIEKLQTTRIRMKEEKVDYYLATALDDIGWLLNLRGRDVECNPVFIAYLLVGIEKAYLFIDSDKVPDPLQQTLRGQGIEIRPYQSIRLHLNEMSENEMVLVDPKQISNALYKSINGNPVHGKSIAKWEKARKNDTEIGYIRKAMEKDGAALAKTFYWLENELKERGVTEAELSDALTRFRGEMDLYYGDSFHSIIGYKGNGAIIHYRPMHGTSATIKPSGMLLVDSGGQYLDGTTDITRTFTLGDTTPDEKENYTLVLKGMIALTLAVFPEGTPGGQLDTLARQYLWQHKRNYLHGTGHGVGFFMNVHEPPQGFAAINSERGKTPIVPGMITSNEPGFYKNDAYGIRIENLVVSEEAGDGYLKFETLTLYPLEHALIDLSLLTNAEIKWINDYHSEVFNRISAYLKGDALIAWFKNKCAHI